MNTNFRSLSYPLRSLVNKSEVKWFRFPFDSPILISHFIGNLSKVLEILCQNSNIKVRGCLPACLSPYSEASYRSKNVYINLDGNL